MNREVPDVQAEFRKGKGIIDQIANICWIIEKARELQKTICFIDYTKAIDCVDYNCGKFFKRWKYQTTLPVSWELCIQVKKQQLELDMEHKLVQNRKRSTSVLYTVTLLIHMQSTSCEMLGWMNHKLKSGLPGELSTTSYMQMIPL